MRVVINDKKTPQGSNASDITYAAETMSIMIDFDMQKKVTDVRLIVP